jgi:hypothetical protein
MSISVKKLKKQTLEKGFAPFKNDITTFELALKYGIHSRTHKVS